MNKDLYFICSSFGPLCLCDIHLAPSPSSTSHLISSLLLLLPLFIIIIQPSLEIFLSFDRIMLLARGKTIFFGPPEETAGFYASQGFPLPAKVSPPDFFLDTIASDFDERLHKNVECLSNAWAHIERTNGWNGQNWENEIMICGEKEGDGKDRVKPTKSFFRVSEKGESLSSLRAIYHSQDHVPFFWKVFYEWKRLLTVLLRNVDVAVYVISSYILVAVVVMFYPLVAQPPYSADKVLSTFITGSVCILSLQNNILAVVPLLLQQRMIFVKERANGFYGTSMFVACVSFPSSPSRLSFLLPFLSHSLSPSSLSLTCVSFMLAFSAHTPFPTLSCVLVFFFRGLFLDSRLPLDRTSHSDRLRDRRDRIFWFRAPTNVVGIFFNCVWGDARGSGNCLLLRHDQ